MFLFLASLLALPLNAHAEDWEKNLNYIAVAHVKAFEAKGGYVNLKSFLLKEAKAKDSVSSGFVVKFRNGHAVWLTKMGESVDECGVKRIVAYGAHHPKGIERKVRLELFDHRFKWCKDNGSLSGWIGSFRDQRSRNELYGYVNFHGIPESLED